MPTGTIDGNREKGMGACRKAKEMGADIALFPEMWNCGYQVPENLRELRTLAVSKNSAFVSAYQSLAAELDMAIGITFLEGYDPLPRNTICLFDRHGKEIFTYAKVHTCDFGE